MDINTAPVIASTSFPAKVKIGAIEYPIRQIPSTIAHNTGHDGYVCYQHPEICVGEGLPPDIKAMTLIHEIIHAIRHKTCLRNANAEEDERTVQIYAQELAALIADNPDVIRWLLVCLAPNGEKIDMDIMGKTIARNL